MVVKFVRVSSFDILETSYESNALSARNGETYVGLLLFSFTESAPMRAPLCDYFLSDVKVVFDFEWIIPGLSVGIVLITRRNSNRRSTRFYRRLS